MPPPPTLLRWVSRTVPIQPADGEMDVDKGKEARTMEVSFSIPASLLPQPSAPTMDVEPPQDSPFCAAEGCSAKRKYRLVKDWRKGACGMAHLKLLEAQLNSVQG